MHSNSREGIQEDFDALRAAVSRIVGHSYDALTCPERLALLERLEQETRRLRVPRHQLINQLAEQTDSTELGGKLPHVLADRLRITRAEAGRRVAEAADLGPRRAVTGEPLPPLLTGTAAGERAGEIGAGHVQVIRRFLNQLPAWVDAGTRESAEQHLAELAAQFRPDEVTDVADGLADCINPDGTYSDEDRARRRGLTLGKQGLDGMSELRALLTPEARAGIEAVLAKTAAPGMCNPEDDAPVVDGSPDDETIQRDTRSAAQRNHDGLNAALRALLASGQLGQHNGLPATIVVTTTLENLEAAAGTGLTGGGTRLPMSDVIRLARHAHHYLALFDKGKAVGLYHTKRLASPGQRIVLYAKDRGCTRPGCNVPGYWCQVHHVDDWASTRHTDVNTLTLACGSDHRLVGPGGWTTRKDARGDTQWIPPPHLDRGQPRVNTFHHPEKILADEDDEDEGAA
ncbi:MAG: HNH endonuclease signature motif containing protein [Mycobacterium sp.]|nr:HNH endonuclease signature motif containing protein [Mycobacterium sp.]HKI39849.1 HNH endonuclease signature motif containing protein [Mycobacterium sp.]